MISAIYQLPFGKGKLFLTHGIVFALSGGWQANTVIGLHSGFPFNITANGAANLNTPGNTQTPDRIGPTIYTHQERTASHQFISPVSFLEVPSATVAGVYRFGTLGLDSAYGPEFQNVDFSLFRTFPVYERVQMQFRADALNLLKHANFGNPSAGFSNTSAVANFGVISSVNSGTHLVAERYFRLGAKLTF